MLIARVRVVDRTADFTRRLVAHMDKNTGAAARVYRRLVVGDITRTPGSDNDDEFVTYFRGGVPVSRRIRFSKPYVHSSPWQAPYVVHGELAASYSAVRLGRMSWAMGSDDPNSLWQELGTSRQEPRPHLRPGLYMHRDSIAAVWTRPM